MKPATSLHFEPHSVEGSLQEMDGAVVGVDDELAIGPLGVFVSADQKLQGELFEDVIVGGLEFVIGKWTEDGAGFGDVLDEQFVGELGEQRFHGGSLQGVNVFNILGTQKMLVLKKSFAPLTTLRVRVKESIYRNHAKHDGAKQRPNPLVLKILLEPEESFTSFTTPSAVSMSMRLV